MQLVAPLRELPLVQMDALNVQPFKRLARLADAHGASRGRARRDADRAYSAAGDAAQRRVAGRQRHSGNGAGKVGLAAGGARAFGHHPGAGVSESGAGRRQVG